MDELATPNVRELRVLQSFCGEPEPRYKWANVGPKTLNGLVSKGWLIEVPAEDGTIQPWLMITAEGETAAWA